MIFAVAAIVFAGTAAPTPRPTSTPVPAPPVEMTVVRSRPDIDGCFLPMGEAFEPGVACMARIVADETAANAPASVLQAQSIVVRTYLAAHGDVCRDDKTDADDPSLPGRDSHFFAAVATVRATRGLVLERMDGSLATEPFRAACESDVHTVAELDEVSVDGRDKVPGGVRGPALCVQGAELRARQGATAFEILARYFPGTRVARPESE